MQQSKHRHGGGDRLRPSEVSPPIGLAYSWQGDAWLRLKLHQAGKAPSSSVRRVRLLLQRGLQAPQARITGALVGIGAGALLAAYCVHLSISSLALFNQWQRRWRAAAPSGWDVLSGTAGALLACAEIDALSPGLLDPVLVTSFAKDTRRALRDMLNHNPRRRTLGPTCQAGLAHGIAGLLLSLESARDLGFVHFPRVERQAALNLLTDQARIASDGALVWDSSPSATLGLQGWCNGTPGVALAFLALNAIAPEPAYREASRRAMDGIAHVRKAWDAKPSMCCGRLGVAHIYIEAAARLGDSRFTVLGGGCARGAQALNKGLGLLTGHPAVRLLRHRIREGAVVPLFGLGQLSAPGLSLRVSG